MELFGPPAVDAPRSEHHAYADHHGYFWAPCPVCSRFFGGHEWLPSDEHSSIHIEGEPEGRGTAICPTCTREGRGADEVYPGVYQRRTYLRMDLDLRSPEEFARDAYAEYAGPRTGPWNGKVELTPEQINMILTWRSTAATAGAMSARDIDSALLVRYLDLAKREL